MCSAVVCCLLRQARLRHHRHLHLRRLHRHRLPIRNRRPRRDRNRRHRRGPLSELAVEDDETWCEKAMGGLTRSKGEEG